MPERTTKNDERQSESSGLSWALFSSEQTTLGSFRCQVSDPRFHNSGPTRGHLLVFPRYHVTITHEGARPVTADLNSVIFYNKGQHYRRDALDSRGDQSEWISVSCENIMDMILDFEPKVEGARERPFQLVRGLVSPQIILHQRQLFALLRSRETSLVNRLVIEESGLGLVYRVLQLNYRSCGIDQQRDHPLRKRKSAYELAEAARSMIAKNPLKKIGLQELANHLECSCFHLSRVFHTVMGMALHEYQNRLKLFASLERLKDPRQDITTLAFEFGYSSHSHFSLAFRKLFGVPPSRLRSRFCNLGDCNWKLP